MKSLYKEMTVGLPVIDTFLASWKDKVFKYYEAPMKEYWKMVNDGSRLINENDYYKNMLLDGLTYGSPEYTEKQAEIAKRYQSGCDLLTEAHNSTRITYDSERQRNVKGKWLSLNQFMSDTEENSFKRMNKILDQDVEAKKFNLVYRTCKKIGKILDASFLSIGDNNELNGYLIGETGKARVETITAGGYNIQCFHFRVLIHIMKPDVTKEKVSSKAVSDNKKSDAKLVNWKSFTVSELEEQAAKLGIAYKQYDNPAIYRMRLTMALKKGVN